MPDLISHTASAYILRGLFSSWVACRAGFPLLLLGVLLPDIVSRGVIFLGMEFYFVAQFFHTPLACLFQSIILTGLFIKKERLVVFQALTTGWIIHQAFDLLQVSLDPFMYILFWPLSFRSFSLGPIWVGHWPYLAMVCGGLALFLSYKGILTRRGRPQ